MPKEILSYSKALYTRLRIRCIRTRFGSCTLRLLYTVGTGMIGMLWLRVFIEYHL